MRSKGSSRSADAVIAGLAEGQFGVVAWWQLREMGVGPQVVQRRVARGALRRVYRGAYAVGGADVPWPGRMLAAVLACGPRAVLSHRSAAQAWGLMSHRAIRPEVTRPTSHRGLSGIVVHHSALRPDEVGEARGIPVTSVPRTLLDIAAMVEARELERCWNEMEVRELRDPLSVPDVIARHQGRRGVAALRAQAASNVPADRTRNDLEEGFLRLVAAHGLPRPRMNAHVALRGRFFEIDALWEAQRLAVELDGGAHRTRRAFRKDRERDRILLAEGFRTGRITWDQLRDEPEQIAADLRSTLGGTP
jgi:very-short-patch-repair endonuclease